MGVDITEYMLNLTRSQNRSNHLTSYYKYMGVNIPDIPHTKSDKPMEHIGLGTGIYQVYGS